MPEPTPPNSSKKIVGLPRWAFFTILAVGILVAYYIYRRNQQDNNPNVSSVPYAIGTPSAGLTSADIGGTPSDTGTIYDPNSGVDYTAQFDALTSQIQQSEADLGTQISSLAASGIGTSTATAPQPPNISVTVPIKVVRPGGAVHKHKKKHKVRHHK